ncbi:capsular biosynthesis protein [Ideonella sp. 4Y11]|uniref:Capsular biosynthesis protein n=1 Tax=Ideonella aquatica TaxID=2824119 RepID=A0A940YQ49_9BURK|nr:capsular biosynthesis protein [Ideonella aquatica]MBQ0959948.1 capsular biosynthesis protein [Ideonella aquatica]
MNILKILNPRVVALLTLVLPTALGTVYYFGLAADRYVSHAVVGVKDTGEGSSSGGSGGLAGAASMLLGGGVAATSLSDTFYLQNYILSMDLLNKLDARLKLREHYSRSGLDPIYRVWSWTTQESFLEFYRNRVEITRDDYSGLLTVDVQGFEPRFAQALSQGILQESEAFINEYSHRIAREKMRFAEGELQSSRKRLEEAKQQVAAFQTTYKLLDPGSQAAAASSLTAGLQAKLAQQEAELRAALAIMQDDSFQVRALRSQLAATRAQLDAERQRSTGASVDSAQLPTLNIKFQELLSTAVFAEEAHKASLMAYEHARLDTTRKLKTVVVIEPPTLPQEALYPRRLYNLFTVMALAFMAFVITRLTLATIREHQD